MRFFGRSTTDKLLDKAAATDAEEAVTAIAALGRLAPTPEIVACLVAATGDATYATSAKSSAAIAALGQTGSTLSAGRLVEILSSGSLSAERAAAALAHSRNDCAVEGLLAIALEHGSYFQVRLAVETLAAIGTPEAKDALDCFRGRPARMLSVAVPGQSSERVSSSSLGQIPTEEETDIVKRHLGSMNVFRFGTREQLRSAITECLVNPERAPLKQLYDLFSSSDALAAANAANALPGHRVGDLMMTRAAAMPAVEAASRDAPARRKEVLAAIQSGDTGQLEAHLLSKLGKEFDREWALGLLQLLPALRQTPAFTAAFGNDELDERTRLAILKVLRKHAPAAFATQIMEHLRLYPASEISTEAAGLIADTDADIIEPVLRLLKDDRWAARRRAVEILGVLRSATASQALNWQLNIEDDFEMRKAIEAAIRHQGKPIP